MKLKLVLALGAALSLCATGAFADKKGTDKNVDNTRGSTKNVDLPKCTASLGSVSITDGDGHGWTAYNLGAPSVLLKAFIQRSGCFTLVDRGAGMTALQKEQALAAGGDLQKGSNVGAGQVKAADYVLIADIANTDANAGGSAVAGVAGGLIGGRVGVGSSRVDLQACKLEYSIVSPK